jgi:hypothetical protein
MLRRFGLRVEMQKDQKPVRRRRRRIGIDASSQNRLVGAVGNNSVRHPDRDQAIVMIQHSLPRLAPPSEPGRRKS